MHMLEFKKLTDFPRGTLYNILCDAYSYDDWNKRFWDGNWKETGDYLYYEIVLSKKNIMYWRLFLFREEYCG